MMSDARTAAPDSLPARPGTTATVFVIFLLSGAASLIYQVVWTRELMLTFGSTVFAVSAVLTAFMAGLALGSWVISRWADRIRDRLRLYGLMEIGVGVYALFFPLLLDAASSVYEGLYHSFGLGFFPLTVVKFVLSLLLLIIPTFLMGGTLPVLSRYLVRRLQMATRQIAYLYALNTAGAVAGTITAGFVLVPATGLLISSWVAVLLNLLVGAIAFVLARQTAHAPLTEEYVGEDVEKVPPPRSYRAQRRPTRLAARLAGGMFVSPSWSCSSPA